MGIWLLLSLFNGPVQWQTVVVAVAISCILGLTAHIIQLMRRSVTGTIAHRIRLLHQASEYAEMGRRLAIYDKVTGFLAPWYFRLRLSEECKRCQRYNRVFTLLAIDASDDDRPALNLWLSGSLRVTDLVCYDGSVRYFLMLSETNEGGASELVKRILREFNPLGVSTAMFPAEPARVDQLLAPLDRVAKRQAA